MSALVISDKQELRRCVKQLVRRADVCEASLFFDVALGETGVMAMMDTWARPGVTPSEALMRTTAGETPFALDAAATFAALDAMDLPVRDLDRAANRQREYARGDYLAEVLDTMRARCVLVHVPMEKAEDTHFDDVRFEALLDVGDALFLPGRYGVNYQGAAQAIAAAAAALGARNIAMNRFDAQALQFCLMPLCEDQGFALHVRVASEGEAQQLAQLLDGFDGVRVLAIAQNAAAQRALIAAAKQRVRLLVCLCDLSGMGDALCALGTRFVPFCSSASLVEMMLGRWAMAKETIWQALCDAYLPLARAGYPLESAAIERDVRRLLSGNLLALCRAEEI